MNKSELIEVIARQADISRAKARSVVRTVEAALAPPPKAKAAIRRRVILPARRGVKFKPGKGLRDVV